MPSAHDDFLLVPAEAAPKAERMSLESDLPKLPDLEAMRERYRHERDKRLRQDGSTQFRELMSEGAHNDIDPNVEPGFSRDPVDAEIEVAIIGGGFGGLADERAPP